MRSPAVRQPPPRPVAASSGGGRWDRVAVAAVLAGVVLAGWSAARGRWTAADWATPLEYGDAYYSDVHWTTAWLQAAGAGEALPLAWKRVPELGAPFAGDWNDFPTIEDGLALVLGLLGRIVGPFAGLNVGLVIAHVLAALTMFAVALRMSVTVGWAFVAGLAFGLAPFLFAQEPHHVTVAYAWHVPLMVLVWEWAGSAEGITRGARRFWAAVAIGVVTGLQNPYYTNVFCQLLLLTVACRWWQGRSRAALVGGLAPLAAAAFAFALMNLDTWSYAWVHGANPAAVVREYRWLEIYGLKLVDLVVPPVNHHSGTFAAFAAAHRAAAPLQDEGSYLGILGILALGWLAVSSVRGVVLQSARVPAAAWQVLWIVLCFSTGGLNAIGGAWGITLFRTGCRMSIVILAIVLLWAARRLADMERTAVGRRPADLVRIVAATAQVAAVLVVCWDQLPRTPSVERIAAVAKELESDRVFVAALERALPAGSGVFQLPVMVFPEGPLPPLGAYEHFRPSLHGDALRYSFGSVKGRDRDAWQAEVQSLLFAGAALDQEAGRIRFQLANVRRAVELLEERGFTAICISRAAYPDRGRGLEDALVEAGHDAPVIRSPAGDLSCVPLAGRSADGR